MTPTVQAHTFEGPLELLLELVERGKMPVTDLSIGGITATYLKRVTEMGDDSSEVMGEFLLLGSRLLYIKSLALLPAASRAEQDEEILRLNEEIEEYRRFQHAARHLGKLSQHRSWQREVVTRLPVEELPLPEITLNMLSQAFERALKRAEPTLPTGEIQDHLSQEEVARSVVERLKMGTCRLDELLSSTSDRLVIIVTFLAVLELLKAGSIAVRQISQFSPIVVEAINV